MTSLAGPSRMFVHKPGEDALHGAPDADDRTRVEEERKEEGKEERLGPTSSVEAVLQDAYGKHTQQLGHNTDGHQCVTQRDREEASTTAASLLYGEVLPPGVARMLDVDHLCAATAGVLYDLGMGTGKLALQAFLQFPSLRRVVGVELAYSRYAIGEDALLNLVHRYPHDFALLAWRKGAMIRIVGALDGRILEFRRANIFSLHADELTACHIVVTETDVPAPMYGELSRMLSLLQRGCRVLSYLNLCKVWLGPVFPLQQMVVNTDPEDRFLTSWSAKRGHHFFLWTKSAPPLDWDDMVASILPRPRSSGSSLRRLARFLAGLRYGFGRAGRSRRDAAQQAAERVELERRSADATAAALALQRAARRRSAASTSDQVSTQAEAASAAILFHRQRRQQGRRAAGRAQEPAQAADTPGGCWMGTKTQGQQIGGSNAAGENSPRVCRGGERSGVDTSSPAGVAGSSPSYSSSSSDRSPTPGRPPSEHSSRRRRRRAQ